MNDLSVNAYLMLSEKLTSENRNIRDKIAGLMWARIANLLRSRDVIALGRSELSLMFDRMMMGGELKEMEAAAEEYDGGVIGDFWAASIYVSKIIISNESRYVEYLVDRYISFLEKFHEGTLLEVQSEVIFILNAVEYLKDHGRERPQSLTDYVRRALSA